MRYANNYIQFMAQNPDALWLWSDEAAFSLCGHVATNTFVKYKEDRKGRPKQFAFENLRNKKTVMGWFAFLDDGTKMDPVRIRGRLNARRYIE